MAYVYLLSHYGEYGSEHVKATLDRAVLPSLLAALMAEQFRNLDPKCDVAGLSALLERTDADLAAEGSHNLDKGWGGIQLHVVLLAEV